MSVLESFWAEAGEANPAISSAVTPAKMRVILRDDSGRGGSTCRRHA
jgi:hypothetical protein